MSPCGICKSQHTTLPLVCKRIPREQMEATRGEEIPLLPTNSPPAAPDGASAHSGSGQETRAGDSPNGDTQWGDVRPGGVRP